MKNLSTKYDQCYLKWSNINTFGKEKNFSHNPRCLKAHPCSRRKKMNTSSWEYGPVNENLKSKCHRQQNKCYPQRYLFALFEATLDFSRIANLLAHNNKSQICYCGQISLQSAAVKCSFSGTFGGNIYFAGDGTIIALVNLGKSELHTHRMKLVLQDKYELATVWNY